MSDVLIETHRDIVLKFVNKRVLELVGVYY